VTDEAVIRPALPADAPTLATLRYAFRAALNEPAEAEAAFVARCTTWMAARLAPGTPWRCWVAERDGVLVGQLWLQLVEKIPNPGPELEHHAYITNVYVDPAARGGLGQRLMSAALDFCRSQPVDSVILWPTERSRSLYARNGFASPTDMMEAVLDTNRHL
jgi:ribosomal protein S18 acetylase RimI-like enzyme